MLAADSKDSGWRAQIQGQIYNSLQDKEQDTLENFQQVAYSEFTGCNSFIKFYLY